MKVGDLVKMKYEMWWMLRSRKDFVDTPAIVLEQAHNAVKVLLCELTVLNHNWIHVLKHLH